MTVAGMFGPRALLAVFPLLLSFYERIRMNDEHRRHTNCTYKHILMEEHRSSYRHATVYVVKLHGHMMVNDHE